MIAGFQGPRRPVGWGRAAAVIGLAGLLGLGAAAAPPAHAIYAGMRNTLDGPAINGVVPTGVATIDQCRRPGYLFDLTVSVDRVNLPDGTTLTVTYGGTGTDGQAVGDVAVGTFALTTGRGAFAGTKAGPAGANDNIYVKHGGAIVVGATERWDVTRLTCS